jgi:hypothetical protein
MVFIFDHGIPNFVKNKNITEKEKLEEKIVDGHI